jgi:hypothetical protein
MIHLGSKGIRQKKRFLVFNRLMFSGGSGNFILSTSCLGFGVTGGGTSPMCLNGYGVFYRLGSDA